MTSWEQPTEVEPQSFNSHPVCPTGSTVHVRDIDNPSPTHPTSSPSPSSSGSISEEPILVSVNVKVICTGEKRNEHKMYILRNVDLKKVQDVHYLKRIILDQFGSDIVSPKLSFDVGYFKGNKRIWIRTNADLTELLQLLQSKGATLWCDGITQEAIPTSAQAKRGAITVDESSESEEEVRKQKPRKKKAKTAYVERLERIDDIVDDLREKHGSKFSTIQYRVWAETISAGRHADLETPPRGSFWRGSKGKESEAGSKVNSETPSANTSTCITPVKAAELKSTYIKQIRELHSLVEIGAISDEDFKKQKDVILYQMDNLHK